MLRGGLLHAITYRALGGVQIAVGTAATLFAAALKTDPKKWSGPVGPALVWAQDNAWKWLFWLIIVAGAAQLLQRYWGPPWRWTLIEQMLSELRQYVFGGMKDSEEHHHRVTLFKRVRWCWTGYPPWGGWVIPMARSSHTTRHGIAKFRAPDDADRAEGVAGRTWAKNDALFVSGLPDLVADESDGALSTYAKSTGISVGWLKGRLQRKKNRPLARSYGGYPVLVAGKPWGVLLLDSRSDQALTQESYEKTRDYYKMVARFLGQLLERAR